MCQSCNEMMINGIRCHEIGCPDSWMGKEHECKECGCVFTPADKWEQFCSNQCHCAYNGFSFDESEE